MKNNKTRDRLPVVSVFIMLTLALAAVSVWGAPDGLLHVDGKTLFTLGFYELPKEDAELARMAEAGVNLVRCGSPADLDRAQGAGMYAWMPLNLAQGATDEMRARVEAAAKHPALAIWEGPDEVVWNFTACSRLYRVQHVHKRPGAWKHRAPEAVAYAEEQAKVIIPNMRAAVAMIHEVDTRNRPVWINEARDSDQDYVRQCLDFVDITGCDYYPIRDVNRDVAAIGEAVRDWTERGMGKPVWMVLQAFSWDELGDYYGVKNTAYPSFGESRFMAYDAIANGAAGILYWGSNYLKSAAFRQSLYALIAELSRLQPFLAAPDVPGVRARLASGGELSEAVKLKARQADGQWLVLLVNEDAEHSFDVVVEGLGGVEAKELQGLYTPGRYPVSERAIAVHLQPLGIVLCATDRKYESAVSEGRDFSGLPETEKPENRP